MADKRLTGWWLTDDAAWRERKAQMAARTMERLATQSRPAEAVIDPLACTADCPICHGDGFTIDHTESAVDCPRWTERKRKDRGDD